ncbi:hypothetical protein B0T20DRAFT_347082, partial [Sordaria brevicollis]
DHQVLELLFLSNTTEHFASLRPPVQAQSGRSCHRRSPLGTSRDGTVQLLAM